MKIKMKSKKIRGVMSAAALLLALALPPAAFGQSDGFFNNADGVRNGDNVSWNDINGSGNGGVWNDINGSGNGGSWNDINGGNNGGSWNGINGGNNGGSWNGINGGNNGGSWNDINGGGNGAAWNGMEDETPVGGGLLVLTAAGVCYAAARVKRLKSKE